MAAVLDLPKRTSKSWTYEDYCRLDDGERYEILDGALLPMQPPSPGASHQRESRKLLVILDQFVSRRNLGEVFSAPFDVILAKGNVVQPDLLFVAESRLSIVQERGVFGAPDLVVEIISPGSIQRDRDEKKALYARFGVREYWLVDHDQQSVEVLALDEGKYVLHSSATVVEREFVTSRVLKGLKVKASDVFAGG
jgi:Uma2 family endonuclease